MIFVLGTFRGWKAAHKHLGNQKQLDIHQHQQRRQEREQRRRQEAEVQVELFTSLVASVVAQVLSQQQLQIQETQSVMDQECPPVAASLQSPVQPGTAESVGRSSSKSSSTHGTVPPMYAI